MDDPRLSDVARAGSTWLERYADLDLDDEDLPSDQGHGRSEVLPLRHFTSAWVVRGVVAAGADSSNVLVNSAMRDVLRCYLPSVGIWRWPRRGGEYPTWMTYHGVAALTAWAAGHQLD